MANLIKAEENLSKLPNNEDTLELGQWFWITEEDAHKVNIARADFAAADEWLGCVMKIGSNFVEFHSPHSNTCGYSYTRVHFDDLESTCRFEPNHEQVISAQILHHQQESANLLEEVRQLSMRLGLDPTKFIAGTQPAETTENSTALAVVSNQDDINVYKDALILAKKTTLPVLFKKLKETNENVCRWMLATTMTMKAKILPMESALSEVTDRIFNVSLYAGLSEDIVTCLDGKPAKITDKLHVMQRRLYMDEECLANYDAGGMEFKNILEFDEWLAKPENCKRILPFPKTLVAMRVRRYTKNRGPSRDSYESFVNFQLGIADKYTFLYIRNGEKISRVTCEIDFEEMIFPDQSMYDPLEAKMVKMRMDRVDEMISVHDYDERVKRFKSNKLKTEEWEKQNPGEHMFHNPFRNSFSFRPDSWQPFDPSNVYFDECLNDVAQNIKKYNRVAVVIQGLLDRSDALHPHPPAKTWTAEGFRQAIELVYDGANTLYGGEKPDFQAYRAKCNSVLEVGSVVTGQQIFWLHAEAERENKRIDADWRQRENHYRHTTFRPDGNPGPGALARIANFQKRVRMATFKWERCKIRDNGYAPAAIRIPVAELFNVDAYKLGDFKQFFNDPRTRTQYLQWAPLLLAAEDYHAGHLRLRED